MEKIIQFNIDEDNIKIKEISDEQLAIAEIWVCHDGNNKHNMPISLDTIKKATPTLLNKFLVASYKYGDFGGHDGKEMRILGFFPKENNIRYLEKDDKTYLVADVILSKVYAEQEYMAFVNNNHRSVSMEITALDVEENEYGENEIKSFIFNGVTVLGTNVQPACEGSQVQVFKFSEDSIDEMETMYKRFSKKPSYGYSDKIDNKSNYSVKQDEYGSKKSLKIDKSIDSMSESAWGDVDKISLRDKILKAKNYKSIVDDVYMIVESGWEDSPSSKLGYPVMEIKGDTLVYNRYGLASALGYAKADGNSKVVSKIEKIRKHLKLDEEDGEASKMSDVENKEKDESVEMSSDANVEATAQMELNEKEADDFKELTDEDKSDKDFADEKEDKEEDSESKEEFSEESEKEEAEETEEKEESESEDVDMACGTKMTYEELEKEFAKVKDESIAYMSELEELRKFKAGIEDSQKSMAVEEFLTTVMSYVPKDEIENFKEMSKEFSLEAIDAWKNSCKAIAFSYAEKMIAKDEKSSTVKIGLPFATDEKKKSGSVWDRI